MNQPLDERWSAWIDGELDPQEAQSLEAEFTADPRRRAEAEAFREQVLALRAGLDAAFAADAEDGTDAGPGRSAQQLTAAVLAASEAADDEDKAPVYSWVGIAGAAVAAVALLGLGLWAWGTPKPEVREASNGSGTDRLAVSTREDREVEAEDAAADDAEGGPTSEDPVLGGRGRNMLRLEQGEGAVTRTQVPPAERPLEDPQPEQLRETLQRRVAQSARAGADEPKAAAQTADPEPAEKEIAEKVAEGDVKPPRAAGGGNRRGRAQDRARKPAGAVEELEQQELRQPDRSMTPRGGGPASAGPTAPATGGPTTPGPQTITPERETRAPSGVPIPPVTAPKVGETLDKTLDEQRATRSRDDNFWQGPLGFGGGAGGVEGSRRQEQQRMARPELDFAFDQRAFLGRLAESRMPAVRVTVDAETVDAELWTERVQRAVGDRGTAVAAKRAGDDLVFVVQGSLLGLAPRVPEIVRALSAPVEVETGGLVSRSAESLIETARSQVLLSSASLDGFGLLLRDQGVPVRSKSLGGDAGFVLRVRRSD